MEFVKRNNWFAVQVKSKREKAVALALKIKGYEEFLPLHLVKAKRTSSQPCFVPLFPGYVFCRLNSDICGAIVTTPGVIRIVGFGAKPFPLADEEIQSIRCIVNSGMQPVACPYLGVGESVRIEQGPLSGVSGFIVRVRNQARVVVSVSLLQRSVAVEIDSSTAVPERGILPHHPLVRNGRPSADAVPSAYEAKSA